MFEVGWTGPWSDLTYYALLLVAVGGVWVLRMRPVLMTIGLLLLPLPAALLRYFEAPQSVIEWIRPRSRAWMTTSRTTFSVIALPICTAPPETCSLSAESPSELKVAPWIPSRPVRPPIATMRSPGSTHFLDIPRGKTPTVPQKTSGLAR